ncbi:EAL domain-containing protein [Thiopseudomonas alkaliphila]|uniref:EAL domain-containing protein n=1 Tax=Thiopseudomonas alkaliphila TaxID=1697053 RepID=A0AAW7DNM6_9GAMM|nr:EAL domain-containing protein [Thiopseudomonas alkaliphila]MDM1695707.1 EAL domain-containing protein [Thiopseudomonas alkaliphila]
MPIERKTIRLLIIEDSQNEAERLVSLFRNAGHATRAHRLTSTEALTEALEQPWDLLISAPTSEQLDPLTALQLIQKRERDISFIQLVPHADSELITETLDLGAQDAVPQGHDQRLLLVAKRELNNLEDRRSRRAAEVALREVEKRCQLLLDSSIDAIAYIHDGMHIYANRSYLNLFNYGDPDDLAGTPMIDLITSNDQEHFKQTLRSYAANGEPNEFNCSLKQDGEQSLPVSVALSNAQYDGEACIQIVFRMRQQDSQLEEQLRLISTQDSVTGLYNRTHFINLIEKSTERAINAGQQSTLAYVKIDNYEQLITSLGVTGTDQLLAQLTEQLVQATPNAEHSRFTDEAFAILFNANNPEQAEEQLTKLLHAVDGKLFRVGTRTAQTTFSIGAAGINETTANTDEVVDRAYRCAESVSQHKGNAVKIYNAADDIAAAANRGDIVAIIQHSLANNSFELLYQPIINLRGNKKENYEVILQARNEEKQVIPNHELIQAASSAKLATKLDRWLILMVIRTAVERLNAGIDTRFFIPLSGDSLQDATFLSWLSRALDASKIPGSHLVFQVTEPVAITYLAHAKELSLQLIQLGCSLCLSQFGGAINPFNTLEHFNAALIKLDVSYLTELEEPSNQERLQEVLTQLHKLDKNTIAPCVESASMLAPLWTAGVHYIQGDYLQAPAAKMNYDFTSE